MQGLMLPLGGYKGSGLALMVDRLSGLLSGAAFASDVGDFYAEPERREGVGHFFVAIDVGRFMPIEQFRARVAQFVSEIHACQPAEGVERVYVPGEIEMENAARRQREGIPLPPQSHLATSSDGLHFERYPVRPILPRSQEGEWDWLSVVNPRLFEEDGVYYMLYAGDAEHVDEPRAFGLATSTDLIHWEWFPGNPIFRVGESGSWDSEAIWVPYLLKRGDEYWLWYCGSQTTYSQGLMPQIGLAIL